MITEDNYAVDAITAIVVITPGSKDVPQIMIYPHDEAISAGTALESCEAANDKKMTEGR